VLFVALTAAWNVPAGGRLSAQSLGEIAKQEASRRQRIQAPAKVVTDGDLKPPGALAAPTVPAAPPASAVALPSAPSANTPPEPKYVARDASYWLARMRELRTKRVRYTLLAAALQDRVDGLTRDFDSTPDRRLRSTIDSELQRVRTERNLVAADVASVDKQIFDLEEEARRSNVPPGWLRP
jgi:hypothetical protein